MNVQQQRAEQSHESRRAADDMPGDRDTPAAHADALASTHNRPETKSLNNDTSPPPNRTNGRLWDFAAGPARYTTPFQASRSRPRLAQATIIAAGLSAAAGVIVFGFSASDPTDLLLSVIAGVFVGVAVIGFLAGMVFAGERLSQFLVRGLRGTGRVAHIAALNISALSCVVAFILLVYLTLDPSQHRGLPAVIIVAVLGMLSGEFAVMSTPPLIPTGTGNGLLTGTVSAVLFFVSVYLGAIAAIFAFARNGISQNIPTAIAVFVLLAGWAWAIHRDGVKRRDEFEQALSNLLVAMRSGHDRTGAVLELESVIVRQERRLFATTPPPLSDPLRAVLFYSLNALTGATPYQLTSRQQEFFERELAESTIECRDLESLLQRLRLRTLLGASGLKVYDARRNHSPEPVGTSA